MNMTWIWAWIFSAAGAAWAFRAARQEKLPWQETLMFAAAFFPAPLFVAIGGGNSFVYLLDLLVPLALFRVLQRWNLIPSTARYTALWLVLGIGFVPVVVAFGAASRQDLLFALANFYRVTGAMAFLALLSAHTFPAESKGACLLTAFSALNLILLGAMLLQGFGFVNSNVFYQITAEQDIEHAQLRFIAAGLFRGSLGMIGMFGIIAYLAQLGVSGSRQGLALCGGLAGVFIIVLAGSKTSLITAILLFGASFVLFPRLAGKLFARVAFIGAVSLLVGIFYLPRLDDGYISQTLNVLGLKSSSLQTFTGRQETWQEGLGHIEADPAILLGFPSSRVEQLNPAYYHNEYVGFLVAGGLWSECLYLFGLLLIGRSLLLRRTGDPISIFAVLAFLGGILQAFTVGHLTPGLLYVNTVAGFSIAYGLAFSQESASAQESFLATGSQPQLQDPAIRSSLARS